MFNYVTWLLENKLNRMIELGKLSKRSIVRAGKASMFKSYRTWKTGFDRGTKNIIKNKGYEIKKRLVHPMFSNTNAMNKTVNMADPRTIKVNTRGMASLIARHEADEVKAISHLLPTKNKARLFAIGGMDAPINRSYLYKGHASPTVLQSEKRYTNFSSSVYGKKSGGHVIQNNRDILGAYKDLGNKSDIKKFLVQQHNDINKAINVGTNIPKNKKLILMKKINKSIKYKERFSKFDG